MVILSGDSVGEISKLLSNGRWCGRLTMGSAEHGNISILMIMKEFIQFTAKAISLSLPRSWSRVGPTTFLFASCINNEYERLFISSEVQEKWTYSFKSKRESSLIREK